MHKYDPMSVLDSFASLRTSPLNIVANQSNGSENRSGKRAKSIKIFNHVHWIKLLNVFVTMLSLTMISFPSSRRHVTLGEKTDIIHSTANHFVTQSAYVWMRIAAGSAMNQNIEIRTE